VRWLLLWSRLPCRTEALPAQPGKAKKSKADNYFYHYRA
jgi:hypothetical protein